MAPSPRIEPRAVRALVTRWRRRLGVDPQWRIQVRVVNHPTCDDLPAAATLEYDSQVWSARLTVDQDLPWGELEYTVVHELLELSLYEQYELWRALLDRQETGSPSRALDFVMRTGMNRFINRLVPVLLAGARP